MILMNNKMQYHYIEIVWIRRISNIGNEPSKFLNSSGTTGTNLNIRSSTTNCNEYAKLSNVGNSQFNYAPRDETRIGCAPAGGPGMNNIQMDDDLAIQRLLFSPLIH